MYHQNYYLYFDVAPNCKQLIFKCNPDPLGNGKRNENAEAIWEAIGVGSPPHIKMSADYPADTPFPLLIPELIPIAIDIHCLKELTCKVLMQRPSLTKALSRHS